MDPIEFGNYILQIRDNALTRKDMAEKTGLHVNTLRGYELEGRLPDIDYLAALAVEAKHDLADLLNKRLLAGKLGRVAEEQHLMVQEAGGDYSVSKELPTANIPVIGCNESRHIDVKLLPENVDSGDLALFDSRQQADFQSQVMVVNTADKVVRDGQVYIVDFGNGAMPRRVQLGLGGSLLLATDSPGMAPLAVPREQIDNITLVGRVVCVLSYT